MEQIGMKKEIDSLGRIYVPKELRDTLGLYGEVELIATTQGLLIRNPEYVLVKRAPNNRKGRRA